MPYILFVIFLSAFYSQLIFAASDLLKSDFIAVFDVEATEPGGLAQQTRPWSLGVELGATITTGNTQTQTVKAKLTNDIYRQRWRLGSFIESLQKTDQQQTQADRWKLGSKMNYDFSPTNSSFLTFEYEEDKFSDYESLGVLATGYTHRLYQRNDILWDADFGPGLRWNKRQLQQTETLTVLHLGANFEMPVSEHAKFSQLVVSDFSMDSETSDVIRAESVLTASVMDNLKMKLSYTFKHDSHPGETKDKLDTQTSVTLLMTF